MDSLFGLDHPAQQKDLAHLRTLCDDGSVSMAKELLQDEQIPFLVKDRGTGNVMRVITGFSIYGVDFYVLPEDAPRATELLDALFAPAEGDQEDT